MNKKRMSILLAVLGGVLLTLSLLAVIISAVMSGVNEKKNAERCELLLELMPKIQNGVPAESMNLTMPSVEIDGESYIGIIDIPAFGRTLPVCESWSGYKVSSHPCRYIGSTYTNNLIVGGSDGKGQFDFAKLISNDAVIYFTDMSGMRTEYTVFDIRRTKNASTENLTSTDADLTLFVKNSYAFEYIIIHCKIG